MKRKLSTKMQRTSRKNQNEAAAAAKKILEDNDEVSNEDVETRRLIEERRNTTRGEKQHLKEVSKQIRKCNRDKKRSRSQEKIQRILEECRGTKNISGIKSVRKRVLIPTVKKRQRRDNHIEKRDCKCLW